MAAKKVEKKISDINGTDKDPKYYSWLEMKQM